MTTHIKGQPHPSGPGGQADAGRDGGAQAPSPIGRAKVRLAIRQGDSGFDATGPLYPEDATAIGNLFWDAVERSVGKRPRGLPQPADRAREDLVRFGRSP